MTVRHLAVRCSRCSCLPVLHDVKVLDKYKEKTSGEMHEVFEIRAEGKGRVRHQSPFQTKSLVLSKMIRADVTMTRVADEAYILRVFSQ